MKVDYSLITFKMKPNYLPPQNSWIKITLNENDSSGENKVFRGYFETSNEDGITISNNQPTAGGFHDSMLVGWVLVKKIEGSDKDGAFEVQ